jgi:hypothetical protein
MYVEFEPMDDFERDLRTAMRRIPAPHDLKSRVVGHLWERAGRKQRDVVWFGRLAASLVLAGLVSGGVLWHNALERRRGEEVKQQLYTALRITNHALEEMNVQLQQRESKE